MALFTPRRMDPGIGRLYAAIIAQARQDKFYRDYGVPDTLDGRFDLLVLHVILVMLRLQAAGSHRSAQALADLMAADLDRNLREMGVGDMGVGKRMRKMGEAFYGRIQAYRTALAGDETALQAALDRNIYGTVDTDMKNLALMAGYVQRQWQQLAGQPVERIAAGEIILATP